MVSPVSLSLSLFLTHLLHMCLLFVEPRFSLNFLYWNYLARMSLSCCFSCFFSPRLNRSPGWFAYVYSIEYEKLTYKTVCIRLLWNKPASQRKNQNHNLILPFCLMTTFNKAFYNSYLEHFPKLTCLCIAYGTKLINFPKSLRKSITRHVVGFVLYTTWEEFTIRSNTNNEFVVAFFG